MTAAAPVDNQQQIEYWNSRAGDTWAQLQTILDQQIAPFGTQLIYALAPTAGERILDIGCGCGQTTLDIAARVSPTGRAVGVDISRPMLQVARNRAAAAHLDVTWLEADAQTADLRQASGIDEFDAACSRFGVMFFGDPVHAFRNVRRSLRRGGRLTFVCWRPLTENPWMQVPLQAALPLLPPPPAADPHAPGPFAFADPARVQRILTEAGFSRVSYAPFDAQIGSGDIDQTLHLMMRVGPLGAALREHPQYKDAVMGAVRTALLPHASSAGGTILLPGGIWVFAAHNDAP